MSKARILVVDDNFFVRESLQNFLDGNGYEPIVAADACHALEAVKTKIDLAIIDMMMPDMDGFQLAGCLRKIQPSLRMVMFTETPTYAADVRAADMGFYEFLPKSNWYDLLILTIENVLAAKEPPKRKRPTDMEQAAEQYVVERKFELAATALEDAARIAEFDHDWERAAALYDTAAAYYGRARGFKSMGRQRLDQLTEAARRMARMGKGS